MKKALVIVPTYNEKDNVRSLAATVFKHVPDVHILYVDDNSPDGTGQILDEMTATEERVHVLHRKDKQGLGRAYIAGFKWALEQGYDYMFEMDADFSHDPASLQDFLDVMEEADLALGSRYVGGIRIINWPLSRLFLSRGASVYVKLITGMPFTDPTGGYKCFRRELLASIDLDRVTSNGYSFQIEMTHTAWRMGFRIVEVPIIFEERRSGISKMSTAIVREALWMVWKLALSCGFKRHGGKRHPNSICAAEGTKEV